MLSTRTVQRTDWDSPGVVANMPLSASEAVRSQCRTRPLNFSYFNFNYIASKFLITNIVTLDTMQAETHACKRGIKGILKHYRSGNSHFPAKENLGQWDVSWDKKSSLFIISLTFRCGLPRV